MSTEMRRLYEELHELAEEMLDNAIDTGSLPLEYKAVGVALAARLIKDRMGKEVCCGKCHGDC